jgi:hypothetical protein
VILTDDLRRQLVQAVLGTVGDPAQPGVVATLIGHQAMGDAPAGMNGFKYAEWIVSYALRQPTKDVFVRVVQSSDQGQALGALHALLGELEADTSRWSAPAHGLWIPTGWPFVDRASLRDALTAMAAGSGPPAVSIEGAFGEGKKTMASYIEHLANTTVGFSPLIRHFRREPGPGVLNATVTDFWMKLGTIPDVETTHAEPERQGTTLARQVARVAPTAPIPIWFVANVVDRTGLEEGLLPFLDELLRLVQDAPEIAQKLRVLLLSDQLALLELENPPPPEARYTLPAITDADIRQWLEAAAPGRSATLYELAAEKVLQRLDAAPLDPSAKLRELAVGCKVAYGSL